MKRSQNENRELVYNLRINGRIWASYRHRTTAEDHTYALHQRGDYDAELTTQNGETLLHLKAATAPN